MHQLLAISNVMPGHKSTAPLPLWLAGSTQPAQFPQSHFHSYAILYKPSGSVPCPLLLLGAVPEPQDSARDAWAGEVELHEAQEGDGSCPQHPEADGPCACARALASMKGP